MKKKIKKLVSSVLAFVIAFSALTIIPGNVLHAWYVSAAELVGGETGAEETYQSGSFTYTLVNEYTNVKLLSCSSDAEGLEIPDTIDGKYVTVLGGQTFQSNKTLKSVTLPKRLEVIEDAAFSGCTSLESVDFPSSLRSIGRNAFSGATALKTAHFAEGLQTIGTYAFNGCTSLESVELPSTRTSPSAIMPLNTAMRWRASPSARASRASATAPATSAARSARSPCPIRSRASGIWLSRT